MKSNKTFEVELLIKDRIGFRVTATTAISAIESIQEIYQNMRCQAAIIYESDSHILTEDPDSGELVYLDLRCDEFGAIHYDD